MNDDSDTAFRLQVQQEVQREVRRVLAQERNRRRRALHWLWFAAALLLPLAGWALPERVQWSAGDPIVAAEMNQNFEALWTAVEALEAFQADTLGRPAPAFVSDGFFDPLNSEMSQVTLAAGDLTTLAARTIDVQGPGHVLVIGTSQLASTAPGGGAVWLNVEGDGTELGGSGTYTSLPEGTAQSATVHNVFAVDDAGTKTYSMAALATGTVDGVSRAAHLTLAFMPD